MPSSTEPIAPQSPMHDCRQPQLTAPAPQVFGTHSTNKAPLVTSTQICPTGQVID